MTRKLAVFLLFVVLWLFYSWTARSDGKSFSFEPRSTDRYNMLVDGFLAGHLYLPVQPDRRLLEAKDPYEPTQNEPYRLHDASLYRGRYYLYFGPAPAVTLLLPFHLLTKLRLPEPLAVALFLFFGSVVSYRIFQFIRCRYAPDTPAFYDLVAVLLLALGNFAPFMLRRPGFYELAIAAGYFYFFAAIFFLLTGYCRETVSRLRLSLAAICLGLAVASRPTYVIAAVFSIVVTCLALWRRSNGFGVWIWHLLPLVLPFACAVLLILGYNYLRFENVLEFGQRYQLSSFRPGKGFSTDYFLYNLRTYLAAPAHIDRHFPFFHLVAKPALIYAGVYGEPVGGMFYTAPLSLLTLFSVPLWIGGTARQIQAIQAGPLRLLLGLFAGSGVVMLALLSLNGGLTERYLLDFVPSFLFSALLVWLLLKRMLTARPRQWRAVNAVLVLLLVFQLTLNMAISLTGYYDNLLESNPATYAQIRSWFSLIEK